LIDLYPTLLEMCGLPPNPSNEGKSLVPLLRNPSDDWRFAVLTTYARENHALRSERFRYMRMEDGTEEFYDHKDDPQEWRNLAGDKRHAKTIKRFRNALPKRDAPYHPSVRSAPTNAWFKEHLARNGLE
jgi:arylsulfatase A-like enzyme